MNKVKLVVCILVLLVLLSCNVLTQPLPTSTPTVSMTVDCVDAHPTQRDIDLALQHSENYFKPPAWERSYSVMEYQVRVTWTSDEYGAVANFDHIIFCDVTDSVLDEYFTTATLDIIMENYDEHELQEECRSNGQRLYQFKAKKYGTDFTARLWAEIVDSDHTRQSLLVFPATDVTNLNSYSRQIMPELPFCE